VTGIWRRALTRIATKSSSRKEGEAASLDNQRDFSTAPPAQITARRQLATKSRTGGDELIVHGDFGREEKCRSAVFELYQQHVPAKVIDFAHD
jgi:hypothetical protein